MKKLIIIAFIICVFLAVFAYIENSLAKSILIKAAKQITGLDARIENLKLGLLKGQVDIDGLYIFNPTGFGDRLMADIPKIYINYDLASILQKKVHIKLLKLELREFIVVRNSDGRLNVNSVKGISKQDYVRGSKKSSMQKPDIRIDVFQLKVGRVLYKDYSQAAPLVSEFPVNIEDRYENITDVDKFVKLIISRALVNTVVSKLLDMDFTSIEREISSFIQKGKGFLNGTDKIKDVGQALKGIAEQLENIFKLPDDK